AADTELAADRRQREDGHRGVAAVPIPLEAPPATHEGGRAPGVQLGDPFEQSRVDAGDAGRPLERPWLGALAKRARPVRVRSQERLVCVPVREEVSVNG